jgi:hypothetical protein
LKTNPAVHPKGKKARILLTSVFGPYGSDDEFGSRRINPMELYQNQVTREQGGFSLRMFHRSFGLLMLQANIANPCTVLDFPGLERFIEELRSGDYDIVGISAINPNVGKVRIMCGLVRRYLPAATLIVGGHIAARPDLDRTIDADHIVRGEGISWLRRFLGQDTQAPVRHPAVYSGFGGRIMGLKLHGGSDRTAAILIPSVGCPVGCNFCSTSAFFGGKGNHVNFFETGDELFSVMCGIEKKLKVASFFVLDENFLLHRKRALRLLSLMEEHNKSWALYIFSSARVIQSYSVEQLLGLGITWVWLGIEGKNSSYRKVNDVDTRRLVKNLQSHGIRVLGSTIIGLEDHTPENLDQAINYAVSHDTDFHQFMLYIPNPGTPLYARHVAEGTLLPESELPACDAHGQYRFNYRHPHLPAGMEEKFLLEAFRRDFAVNGPSLYRLIRTMLEGWKRHKNHPDRRVRKRFRWDAAPLRTAYAGAVWAMKKWHAGNPAVADRMGALLEDLCREFGWKTRAAAPLIGRFVWVKLRAEERRLASGWSYEPRTFRSGRVVSVAPESAAEMERFRIPEGGRGPEVASAKPR